MNWIVYGKSLLKIRQGSRIALLLLGVSATLQGSGQQLPPTIEQPADSAGVFAIYPGSGVPRDTENWTWHEATVQIPGSSTPNRMVRNVVVPTLTLYKPSPGTANGTALIVAPGGAFRFLMFDLEGADVAHALAPLGVTVFVLRYRVAHTPDDNGEFFGSLQSMMSNLPHPGATVETPPTGGGPAEEARSWADADGLQAIRYVRQHASEWSVDPKKIGIVGFSAGGGIAVDAAMGHTLDSRPDFVGGIYPGYRPGITVPDDAPPLFVAATDDDVLVAPISGARLYEAWHAAGKPAELHIFAKGQHGFAMKKQNLPSDAWIDLFTTWMRTMGYIPAAATKAHQ
jgi:acetyl esterase/lipase